MCACSAGCCAIKDLGKLIVPIVPDEARTFGMEALFRFVWHLRQHGGQLYDPVDSHLLLKYEERKNGQILEEGITEAGSMASFTAAATSYANARRQHDPILCVLLHVRLPARG